MQYKIHYYLQKTKYRVLLLSIPYLLFMICSFILLISQHYKWNVDLIIVTKILCFCAAIILFFNMLLLFWSDIKTEYDRK